MKAKLLTILVATLFSTPCVFGQSKQTVDKWNELSYDISRTHNLKFEKSDAALYMFALKITIKADGKAFKAHAVSTSDSICYKLYPKLDSIIKAFDFSIVPQANPKVSLVIPFAVMYLNNENKNEGFNIPLFDLPGKFQKMFYFSEKDPFQKNNVYLSPIILSLNIQH